MRWPWWCRGNSVTPRCGQNSTAQPVTRRARKAAGSCLWVWHSWRWRKFLRPWLWVWLCFWWWRRWRWGTSRRWRSEELVDDVLNRVFGYFDLFDLFVFCVFSVILKVMFKALSICQYLCSSKLDPIPRLKMQCNNMLHVPLKEYDEKSIPTFYLCVYKPKEV